MAAVLTDKEKAIICLQCHIRGSAVRSRLRDVQKEFEDIVHHLDGPDVAVLWPANKGLFFPLVTKDIDKLNRISGAINTEHKLTGTKSGDECEETLTQKKCDQIHLEGTFCADSFTTQTHLRGFENAFGAETPDDMDKLVRKRLEKNFDETTTPEKTQMIVKSDEVNSHNVNHRTDTGGKSELFNQSPRSSSSGVMESQLDNISPVATSKPDHTQHSTPMSSDDPEHKVTLGRHPLLTDSWMTDKSFDPVSDISTNKHPVISVDLTQRREQVAMEMLWTQQAIESRTNYLRLKKNISCNADQEDS